MGLNNFFELNKRYFLFRGNWDSLYTEENNRCLEVIEGMIERIHAKDIFPSVEVFFIMKNFILILMVIIEQLHTTLQIVL